MKCHNIFTDPCRHRCELDSGHADIHSDEYIGWDDNGAEYEPIWSP